MFVLQYGDSFKNAKMRLNIQSSYFFAFISTRTRDLICWTMSVWALEKYKKLFLTFRSLYVTFFARIVNESLGVDFYFQGVNKTPVQLCYRFDNDSIAV